MTLFSFNIRIDGYGPSAPLIEGRDGKLYGVARSNTAGIVYRLNTNLPPKRVSQPLNISTRINVLEGDKALIGGFIVSGNVPKKVILRAVGPSLSVPAALADPTLELHFPDGSIAANDNWKIDSGTGQSQESLIRATTIPPSNDLESALVASLPPGAYTAVVRGKQNTSGVAAVEAYDLNPSAASDLANISTRGFVATGDDVMIGGFIVGPNAAVATTLVVRAIGPSLSTAGIADPIQNPTLELHNADGDAVASNDDWQEDSGASEMQAANLEPGDARESAILRTLGPGAYTAVVRGVANSVGTGLVEVYNLGN